MIVYTVERDLHGQPCIEEHNAVSVAGSAGRMVYGCQACEFIDPYYLYEPKDKVFIRHCEAKVELEKQLKQDEFLRGVSVT